MSAEYLALADLLKVNNKNLADIQVSDLLNDAPLVRALAAVEPSKGKTAHEYLKETTAPTVGFRDVNDGRENSKSDDTLVQLSLKILDCSFDADKALADGYMRGSEAYIAREARRHLRAGLFGAEEQFIYGTDNDADGFNGLADVLDNSDDSMVYDAEGTTDETASSVWLIRTGEEDTAIVAGNDGNIEIDETTVIQKSGDTGTYPAYYTPIYGWLGLQAGSAYSFARICNITEDSGHTLTDDMIYEALALFPASRQPNIIAMNRRSLKQLRDSRTATNATGAPAPRPTEVDGIPIIGLDSITSTETLLSASGS